MRFDGPRMASPGGKAAFPICPACDDQGSKTVIGGLNPQHPTLRLFKRGAGSSTGRGLSSIVLKTVQQSRQVNIDSLQVRKSS
jgi:hypothetical protein